MRMEPEWPRTTCTSCPPLYGRWLGELLAGGISRKMRTTCDNCAMCVKGDGTPVLSRKNHYGCWSVRGT